jgi:hypothetical protein
MLGYNLEETKVERKYAKKQEEKRRRIWLTNK